MEIRNLPWRYILYIYIFILELNIFKMTPGFCLGGRPGCSQNFCYFLVFRSHPPKSMKSMWPMAWALLQSFAGNVPSRRCERGMADWLTVDQARWVTCTKVHSLTYIAFNMTCLLIITNHDYYFWHVFSSTCFFLSTVCLYYTIRDFR